LNALAKKEWCRLVPELLKHGLLTKIDRAALAAYCVTYGRWIEAEVQLKTEGLTIKTPSGYEQASPWLSVANKALALMRSYASEFGLSPATRSRVSAVDPLKQPGEWDRFLNGED
jgi:P27 family predicted phage terminase small subunit